MLGRNCCLCCNIMNSLRYWYRHSSKHPYNKVDKWVRNPNLSDIRFVYDTLRKKGVLQVVYIRSIVWLLRKLALLKVANIYAVMSLSFNLCCAYLMRPMISWVQLSPFHLVDR